MWQLWLPHGRGGGYGGGGILQRCKLEEEASRASDRWGDEGNIKASPGIVV